MFVLFQQFQDGYDATILIVRSNFGKEFAFFIPNKFQKSQQLKLTGKQLAFYWINDKLVTCTNTSRPEFISNEEYFIWIRWGLFIENNWSTRYYSSRLDSNKWADIQQDIHGYPF